MKAIVPLIPKRRSGNRFSSHILTALIICLHAFRSMAQVCTMSGSGGPTAFVQYETAGNHLSKCGVMQYTNPVPPRVAFYHHQKIVTDYTITYLQHGTNGLEQGGECVTDYYSDGDYYDQETDKATAFTVEDFLPYVKHSGCVLSNFYSGTLSWDGSGHDYRTHSFLQSCTGCNYTITNRFWGGSTNVSPQFIGGVWSTTATASSTNYEAGGGNLCVPELATGTYATGTNYSITNAGVWTPSNIADLLTVNRTNHQEYTNSPPGYTSNSDSTNKWTGTQVLDLDQEYTDDELQKNIIDLMDWSSASWYEPSADYFNFWQMIAYSVINGDHYHADVWTETGDAELQNMKYRFRVPGASILKQYSVTWDLVTYDIPAGTVKVMHMSAPAFGGTPDTDGNVYSPEQIAPPPPWDSSMDPYGGYVITMVENVAISESPWLSYSWGGSAGIATDLGISTDSGCATCGSSGASSRANAAAKVSFSLGQATNGFGADPLQLFATQPTLAMATPAGLNLSTNNPELEVIMVNGSVRQVTSPQVFIDIVTNNIFNYEIRYYYRSQRGLLSSGLYGVSGSPFVIWKVENPDASTNTYNRLRLTETRGTDAKVYDYSYTGSTNTDVWKLDYPGGLREDEMGSTVIPTNSYPNASYTRYVTNVIRVPGGATQYKTLQMYKFFGDEGAGFEAIAQETIDPDNNPKTTTYSYYDTSGKVPLGSLKPLKLVTHPDGSWEYYSGYDSLLRPGQVYSSFGDCPAPTGSPDSSLCRYTWISYYPLSSDDDGTRFANVPRQTQTFIKNNLVSGNYMVSLPDRRFDVQGADPYASWDAATNLLTTTIYYTNGVNNGKVKSVQNPDGTMALYEYGIATDGSWTNIVSTGAPNTGGTAIVDGTKSVTIYGPVGQMISQTEADIASGIVTMQDVYGNYDSLNRPQQVTHLDGTTDQTQYACCGVDNTTDRDGVITQFLYDQMKRQVGSRRLNITTTNILDAVGRTLQTIRIGSDNSKITNSQSSFSLAGEVLTQTNALSGVTSYIHTTNSSTGARVEITVNPDGGTATNLYYIDGSTKQVSGTSVHGSRYQYDSGWEFQTTVEIKLNTNYTDTAETVTNYSDALGRSYRNAYSGGGTNQSFYNNKGQLWKTVDPDGVVTLYQYNAKGEQEYVATDMDRDDSIGLSGTDRITRTVTDVTTDGGYGVRRTRTYGWLVNGSSTSTLLSTAETSFDGLRSWQTQYRDVSTPVTSQSGMVFSTGGYRYFTNTAPDGSYSLSTYLNGRLVSVTSKDSAGNQLSSVSYAYDAHGRQYSSTDARNGDTIYIYNNADRIASVTTPSPGNGGGAQTTTTYYNTSLQATNVAKPDGTSVITEYLPTGERLETHGSHTYPVAYTYDYAGRMKTMKTWQNFAGNNGVATTIWTYSGQRGFLTVKTNGDGSPGISYSYTPAGRLQTRTWARGIVTTYGYDAGGSLTNISYSDSTPAVAYAFDRMGRQSTIVCNGMTDTLTYNLANQVLGESYSGGDLAGLAITNSYDTYLRRTNLAAMNGASALAKTTYSYTNDSRLFSVSDGNSNSATYSYVANSPLVSQIAFKSNNFTAMTTFKSYDYLNRLTQISNAPSASAAVTFNYTYNDANQRTKDTLVDGSYWLYRYDSLGQVTSGKKYWRDGTPVPGQQFEYSFDDIGNRTQTKAGGDETGASLRLATYTNNMANQITGRDVPGYVDVLGIALATNSVTVNGQPTYRKGEYFRKEWNVDNISKAVWTNMSVASPGQSAISGSRFLQKTNEVFAYDADGNLTNDGRWSYSWDGENRLKQMTVNTNVGPQYQLTFGYDPQGRRIRKQVATNGVSIYTNRFVYDRWDLMVEVAPNNSMLRSYVWGTDLSGRMRGAGNAGGLLEVGSYSGQTTNCFVAYDGNGNAVTLCSAVDGAINGNYEYGPFGEVIRATGPMAKANPFRFSTKLYDDESELLYYGHRYYHTGVGRWLSRDKIEENGGSNQYGFISNNPIINYDVIGLEEGIITGGTQHGPYEVTNPFQIGNVKVWLNASIVGATSGTLSINDIIAIRFNGNADMAGFTAEFRWVQFIRPHWRYKGQDYQFPVPVAGSPYWQMLGQTYLDSVPEGVKNAKYSAPFYPNQNVSGSDVIMTDRPGVSFEELNSTPPPVDEVFDEFWTFLLYPTCHGWNYAPAFELDWTMDQAESGGARVYSILSAKSISKLPPVAAEPEWVMGRSLPPENKILAVPNPTY